MAGSYPKRESLSLPLPPGARQVHRRLVEAGERSLIAGGAVRDALLGRPTHDFDIASSAPPERIQELFSRTVEVGAQFGVCRVLWEDEEIEVARFRADLEYRDGRHPVGVRFSSEEEDAKRRDFTVNGLFFDPDESAVLDYVGGLEDLRQGVLRAIGDPRRRFAEDRLRLLRAVRFATTLGFRLDTATWEAVLEAAPRVSVVSGERIRQELERLLVHPRRELGFFLLSDSGLMQAVLPEVEAMRGVAQPPEYHPEGDVHRHTALVLSHLESPSFTEALGALLHDVAKPVTYEEADRIRFNQHDVIGAEMAEEICDRLRLSRREKEEVVYLVRRHMVFMNVEQMRVAKQKRLFEEPHFPSLLRLGYADCRGSHGMIDNCERVEALYESYLAEGPPVEPLLRGRDLLALGLVAGPLFGRILEEVEDARREGELSDREAALAWVRERYPPAKGS